MNQEHKSKFYIDLHDYEKSINWDKASGAREFDQRETLVKAKKYLELAQTQGFELAYAQLNADIAKLDWFLARVSLALEEKGLKQKTENWLNAATRLAHTKNACRPCDTNGQVSQDNSHYHDNKTVSDMSKSACSPSSGNTQLCGTDNQDVKCQCNKCAGSRCGLE